MENFAKIPYVLGIQFHGLGGPIIRGRKMWDKLNSDMILSKRWK